jgi:hypothetical protein
MSISQLIIGPIGQTLFNDPSVGAITDGISATPTSLNNIILDDTANGPTGSSGGTAAYLKLYNLQSGLVVAGVTEPDEVIYGPTGALISVDYFTTVTLLNPITLSYYTISNLGKSFSVALSAACETTGTTGATGSTGVNFTADYEAMCGGN